MNDALRDNRRHGRVCVTSLCQDIIAEELKQTATSVFVALGSTDHVVEGRFGSLSVVNMLRHESKERNEQFERRINDMIRYNEL